MKMIKKISLLILLTTCLSLFTGCVRFNATINIKDNGRADVSILYATMETDDESDDISLTQEEIREMQENGWIVESYNRSGYSGYKMRMEDASYNNITDSLLSGAAEAGEMQLIRNGFDYILNWQVFDKDEMTEFSSYKEFIEMSEGYMNVIVTLPVVPKNTNATSVSGDGKTLEWNLLEESNVYIEYTLINKWLIVALCALVILIIIIVIVKIKKHNNTNQDNDFDYEYEEDNPDESLDFIEYSYPDKKPYSVADEIMKLKQLLDAGAITQEEYDKQKQKFLNE